MIRKHSVTTTIVTLDTETGEEVFLARDGRVDESNMSPWRLTSDEAYLTDYEIAQLINAVYDVRPEIIDLVLEMQQ